MSRPATLMHGIAYLRQRLQAHLGLNDTPVDLPVEVKSDGLSALQEAFKLTSFELEILTFCAAAELDPEIARWCGQALGDPLQLVPTFGLCMSLFPDAYWGAITPQAPLRRWRLVELQASPGVLTAPLRLSERVLHHLRGVSYLEGSLEALVTLVPAAPLVPSHASVQARLTTLCIQLDRDALPLPVILLYGPDEEGRSSVAAGTAASLGLSLYRTRLSWLPQAPEQLETFILSWERAAVLGAAALYLELDHPLEPQEARLLARLLVRLNTALWLGCRERVPLNHAHLITVEIVRPTPPEQAAVWESVLPPVAAPSVPALVQAFDFSAGTIRKAALSVQVADAPSGVPWSSVLWRAGREQTRGTLDGLARRIEPRATWRDLVLPARQERALRDIAAQVRHRSVVHGTWGFQGGTARGLGITALFTGPSGTGKTLAAEVLAHELDLDLYAVDLSGVVSKYIGETEKNLASIFDAADQGGSLLLFDEADALFGKRTEVKDSQDRHANIEVSYLLQRLEAFRGLAILTTNLKSNLDIAFLRRLRFVVPFPFPEAAQRQEMWRRAFPEATPTEDLDYAKLSRLQVAGGNIRTIVLNAAYLAAAAGEAVTMGHMLRAVEEEYAKLEKPLASAEVAGWL